MGVINVDEFFASVAGVFLSVRMCCMVAVVYACVAFNIQFN